MTVRVLAACRRILQCYLAFEIEKPDEAQTIGARFSCDSFETVVPVYPLERSPGAPSRQWVAVFPHAEDPHQKVSIYNTNSGAVLGDHEFTNSELKWQSRIAYKTKRSLTARMCDIEQRYRGTGISIDFLTVYPVSPDEEALHIDLVFPYSSPHDEIDVERMMILGVCNDIRIMEDGIGDDGKRHVRFSMRVAQGDEEKFILSQPSSRPGCQPGLVIIDAPMRKDHRGRSSAWLASAAEDPQYPEWLARHQAQPYVLAEQQAQHRSWSACALMVVDRLDTQAFKQAIFALLAQSVSIDKLFLIGAAARRAKSHARDLVHAGITVAIASSVDDVCNKINDAYVLVLDQNDILEPNALFELGSCLHDRQDAQAVYPDDDRVDKTLTRYEAPRLKPDLNVDLLYASNYIGSCLLMKRDLLDVFSKVEFETAAQLVYATGLYLSRDQSFLAHVPKVLCHRREARRPNMVPEADPAILAAFLHEQNVSARIAAEEESNHVIYDIPDPAPLISIVIPNKDHVELLEPCVLSILEKAGYDSFEIVLVENNSGDSATFELYDKLMAHDDRIKVVTYDGDFNYSKIINYGVSKSQGELLLLLNNDTRAISDGFLRIMAGYLMREDVGVVGPLLRYPDGLVQNAGIALMSAGHLGFINHCRTPGLDTGYLGSLVHPYDYSAVLGACQMVRRRDFEALGGYAEELAITYNDVDFCWRLRERGLLCVFTPYAELYHLEFATRGRDRVNAKRAIQTEQEAARMRLRWPEAFTNGDPVYNPACDQSTPYFKLGK